MRCWTGRPRQTGASLLSNVTVNGLPLIDDAAFLAGGTVTMTYTPNKGGRVLDPQTITLDGATTTLDDLLAFLEGSLAINTDDGASGGTVVGGVMQMEGNVGTLSDFAIDGADFQLSTAGSTTNLNFSNETPVGQRRKRLHELHCLRFAGVTRRGQPDHLPGGQDWRHQRLPRALRVA